MNWTDCDECDGFCEGCFEFNRAYNNNDDNKQEDGRQDYPR